MTAICGSDDDAVQRWAVSDPAGDAVDVSALHREHFIHLTRLAVMLVGDRETAEDVVQDVFATMQSRWRMFTSAEPALRYVHASVINRARSVLRGRRAAARYRPAEAPDEQPAEQAALTNLRDGAVRQALLGLTDRQREVILLRYLEELTITETGRVLGISAGAVKTAAARGLRSLAAMLGDPGD